MQLVLLTSNARHRIMRSEYSPSHAARLCLVACCSNAEAWEGAGIFFRVREVLVVEVVTFGERGVKQGEMPLEIGMQI